MTIQRAIASTEWTGSAPITAVLLHGFGSDEGDLASIGRAVLDDLPWLSPRGMIDLPHGGAAWFPISTPGMPDPASVDDATGSLWDWIDETVGSAAVIVPIGFSQGGLMATQLLGSPGGGVWAPLLGPPRPSGGAATVVMGGFVQAAVQPADEQLSAQRPAVFWGRGEDDQVITAAAVARTSDWLPGHSTLTARTYPRLAHSISPAELADVRAFLGDTLAGAAR